jgi:hypothetical protein
MTTGHDLDGIDDRRTEVERVLPVHGHRIAVLEHENAAFKLVSLDVQNRLSKVETDIAWMRSNFMTREELQKELRTLLWQIVGAMAFYTAGLYFIARTVHP